MLNYDTVRYGAGFNDWRLEPPRPIRTADSVEIPTRTRVTRDSGPLRIDLAQFELAVRPGLEQCISEANALIRASNSARAARGARTSDELLESMTSGKTISRGTVWEGTGENPQLDEKVAPVRDFVSGFIPGNIVHAEDPGTVIDLGRVYLPQVEDDEVREALGEAIDAAEEEWKKDKRSRDDACDIPPHEKTKDSMAPRTRLYGFGKVTPAAQYSETLKAGRKTQDATAPAKVTTAADYARNLAAGRAAKS